MASCTISSASAPPFVSQRARLVAASRCGIASASKRRRFSFIFGTDRHPLRDCYGRQYRGGAHFIPALPELFPAGGLGETVEQIMAVHRPRRGFRMILDAEHVPAFDRDT